MLFVRKYGVYLIGLLTFCLYYPTISYDYNLDDQLVTQGQDYAERDLPVSHYTSYGLDSLSRIFAEPYYQDGAGNSYGFRPIVHMSFALEHEFFGESAAVSHTINALLYALLSVMLALLLRQLFPQWEYAIVLLATLLFAVHPMHVEVVASIKNRDEILALLFFLFGWHLLIRYSKHPKLSIFIGVACFALSIYSKLSLLFMPGVVVLFLLRHEKFSLGDTMLYMLGVLGVIALRMEWTLGFVITVMLAGLFLIYFFHCLWSKENRNTMMHQARLVYHQFALFRKSVKNTAPKSGLLTSWRHWSFISGILLVLVSYLGGKYISPSLFYSLSIALGFTCLIFWIRIPHYIVLGLLGGFGLQMDFNGHYLMVLPLFICMLSASDEEDELWNFPRLLGYVWPSAMIFSIVLTASEFWESRSMLNVVLAYMLPFGLIPLRMLKMKWGKKMPQVMLWFVSIGIGLWIAYIINLGPSFMEKMPIYLGLFLSFLPKVGFFDKPFQRIGFGGVFLLIFAIFFHILPVIQAQSDQQIAESENVVESVKDVNGITAEADSIPMSKLGRILDLSENPMVGVDDFSARMAFTFDNIFHYHRQMLLSTPWSAYYGYGAIGGASWSSFQVLAGLGLLLLLLFILISGWVRGISAWWIGACIVLFGLLPFVNLFVLMAGGVADRYTFGASLGMVILVVSMLRQFKALKRQGILAILGLSIVVLIWRCSDRMPFWENKEALYTASLEQFPEAAKVHYLFAGSRADQAFTTLASSNRTKEDVEVFVISLDSALASYKRAVSIYPKENWEADRNRIYEALMEFNFQLGADKRALELLQEYCAVDAVNGPKYRYSFIDLALNLQHFETSYEGFLLLTESAPLETHFTLYSEKLSRYISSNSEVKEVLERTLNYGIELFPNSANLYFNYGRLLMTYNDFSNALVYLNKALEINPQLNDLEYRISFCEGEIARRAEQ